MSLTLVPIKEIIEDANWLKYVEQELAKKRGKNIDVNDQIKNDLKHAEDELYKIPEHLKVKKRNSEESSTQWTTGIAEVQLPIENIWPQGCVLTGWLWVTPMVIGHYALNLIAG
ncbi:hypothetical protein KPL71_027205 [Citrus sinensis]|uniref:Uncharacterized protein n=1 Tax=Citrus sinensis TaxID=2711 RepID=A0ACB8I4T9_CITSI|nr:hypothetical protein KPL71_027205 [Citrus sinensis]